MSGFRLTAHTESWEIDQPFKISRGSKKEAKVVVVEINDGTFVGRGECVPYARYGENSEKVLSDITTLQDKIASRQHLQELMKPGAARNAIDCALWDLEAKQKCVPVHQLAGVTAPAAIDVTYTISLDVPEKMATDAHTFSARPILKIKLGGDNDPACIAAVRHAAPQARLIVDANEGWSPQNILANIDACLTAGVELIEQPLPSAQDGFLASIPHKIPICADESVFDRLSLPHLIGKYDAINVKLDKCGGLTEALALIEAARAENLTFMVGCMVSTSLAIAPAFLLTRGAAFADLDGALLLKHDRDEGLRYHAGKLEPPTSALWG